MRRYGRNHPRMRLISMHSENNPKIENYYNVGKIESHIWGRQAARRLNSDRQQFSKTRSSDYLRCPATGARTTPPTHSTVPVALQ